MRQQSQSQPHSTSGHTIESVETRKQRMDKKRAIRKNKVGVIIQQPLEMRQEKGLLTKQEKMRLQKAKNREAAQKSRDQHRAYVQALQEQNKVLKEQMSRPRYCAKCSKQMNGQLGDTSDSGLSQLQNRRHLSLFVQEQRNHELQEFESPFIRMHEYDESSPLKMFLFISMIVLGVFLLNGSPDGSTNNSTTLKRDLIQIQNLNIGPVITNQKAQYQSLRKSNNHFQQIRKLDIFNTIENNFNMDAEMDDDKLMTEVVPLSYQLSPLTQQNCLRSIINRNYTQHPFVHPDHAIRTPAPLGQDQHFQLEVFSPTISKQNNHNILFCSLPKLYKKSEEIGSNFLSKFIDIIINGSQMMEIIGDSPNLWMNKVINFNGIYKINAQVKQIVQIQDINCIL